MCVRPRFEARGHTTLTRSLACSFSRPRCLKAATRVDTVLLYLLLRPQWKLTGRRAQVALYRPADGGSHPVPIKQLPLRARQSLPSRAIG